MKADDILKVAVLLLIVVAVVPLVVGGRPMCVVLMWVVMSFVFVFFNNIFFLSLVCSYVLSLLIS